MSGRILSWPAPGAAVVALDGPGAVAVAKMLARELRHRKANGGTLSRTEEDAVGAIVTAAKTWSIGAALALATDLGSEIDTAATSGGNCGCTTLEASQRLRISQRAVRQAIARGALAARQATARGPHVITEQSIAAYEAKRIART